MSAGGATHPWQLYELLHAAGVGFVLVESVGVGVPAGGRAADRRKGELMKIGVSLYSFNRLIQAGRADRNRAVVLAGEIGLDGLEMLDMYWSEGSEVVPGLDEARDFAGRVRDAGLDLCCYTLHSNLGSEDARVIQEAVDRVKRQIEVGAAMGVSVMRIESCYGPANAEARDVDPAPYETRVVEATRDIVKAAAAADIRLGIGNHGRLLATSRQMVSIIERVGSPYYGATIDIGNFVVVDEDSVDATRALAPHAVHVHAKDFLTQAGPDSPGEGWGRTEAGRYYQGCVIGEGAIPVKECLKTLVEAGYDGYLAIEYEGRTVEPVEGVRRGAANLRTMLNELGQ